MKIRYKKEHHTRGVESRIYDLKFEDFNVPPQKALDLTLVNLAFDLFTEEPTFEFTATELVQFKNNSII